MTFMWGRAGQIILSDSDLSIIRERFLEISRRVDREPGLEGLARRLLKEILKQEAGKRLKGPYKRRG